jgi:hypothetical protein
MHASSSFTIFIPDFTQLQTQRTRSEHEWIENNRRRYAQKSAAKAEKLPAIAIKRLEFSADCRDLSLRSRLKEKGAILGLYP